ncbi:probable nucleotide-sugar transporter [Rhynchosporium agropyri]|uniref:Probable nucleotide-sugar transporter n=1 Tax=Rhynchosporium agropyri TaxID=914238 RepID=A0A1E1KV75_9HELO|nr:probable nucleotide-sugar transporter [Rhynchosporium agropyri]
MAFKGIIPVLVALMLLTGVCNTLLTKYQDNICVRDCDNPDLSKRKNFEQPVIQTMQMFIGEMGSWLFVGAFALYKHFFAKNITAQENGYAPVNTQDHGPDNDAASVRSTTPINPALKSMAIKEDRIPLKGWKVALLSLPAICDICGTTLMNVGLLFVVPSIYQMTRGALVLFVGLFSVIFLRRKLHLFQWFALFTVVTGVAIVGLAGALFKDHKAAKDAILLVREAAVALNSNARSPAAVKTIIGIFLIAGAQIFTAFQFVLEEYILEKYALEPLKVVGWEGLFGFTVTVFGMLVMHLAVGRTAGGKYGYFDIVEGWRQVTSYEAIRTSSILIMISIGGFNFFGLSVTRTVSATARSTIDTCRTLFIWIVSLALHWETFKWLQLVGFALLVYGTFLFNGLVRPPLERCVVSDYEELLPEEPIEHL